MLFPLAKGLEEELELERYGAGVTFLPGYGAAYEVMEALQAGGVEEVDEVSSMAL